MNNELKEELVNFKTITVNIIKAVEDESYDALEELFCKRQEVIDKIDLLEYSERYFTEICSELDMILLQEKLGKLLNTKQSELKAKINKFSAQKAANRSYNNKFSVDSIYFNKRI